MNEIKLWAVMVCAAAIAASVATLAAPEGKIQKVLRCVIGIFFVCCIVSPFAKGIALQPAEVFGAAAEEQALYNDGLASEITKQTVSMFSENVKQIVTRVLNEQNIFPQEISLNVHVDENSDIYISSIVIKLDDSEAQLAAKVQTLVKEQTGISPEILTGGETTGDE